MGTPADRGLFRPSWSQTALGRLASPTWRLGQAMLIGLVLLANCLVVSQRDTASGTAGDSGATPAAATEPGVTTTKGSSVAVAQEDLRPTQIAVPRIGIRTSMIGLGTAKDGTLEVPADFGVAGWYTGGPPPGRPGAAVVVGHVDSYTGPAVFFRLRELRKGDRIDVRRKDGSLVQFRVEWSASYAKDKFPTGLVYQATDTSTLRLVTCGGTFDRKSKSYRDNLVVFARAERVVAPARPAGAPARVRAT